MAYDDAGEELLDSGLDNSSELELSSISRDPFDSEPLLWESIL